MGSPIIQPEYLEKYNELYTELIDNFAKLYHSHRIFIKNVGRDSGLKTRKDISNIIYICKQLRILGGVMSRETLKKRRENQDISNTEKQKKESSHIQVANNKRKHNKTYKELTEFQEELKKDLSNKKGKEIKRLEGFRKDRINNSNNKKNDLDI